LARSQRTALISKEPLGSAEITHAFHPFRGQRFAVLKVRRVSGVASLSMLHAGLGSFAVPQEWTDWRAPREVAGTPLIIDAAGLAELADIVDLLGRDSKGIDR
jgi:Family of unknown function (DUF5372)